MVGKPRYMEIVDWVKERLERKELGPGERLNSENELSELFGLSRQTVRHAIGVLRRGSLSGGRGAGLMFVMTGWLRWRIRRGSLL